MKLYSENRFEAENLFTFTQRQQHRGHDFESLCTTSQASALQVATILVAI